MILNLIDDRIGEAHLRVEHSLVKEEHEHLVEGFRHEFFRNRKRKLGQVCHHKFMNGTCGVVETEVRGCTQKRASQSKLSLGLSICEAFELFLIRAEIEE